MDQPAFWTDAAAVEAAAAPAQLAAFETGAAPAEHAEQASRPSPAPAAAGGRKRKRSAAKPKPKRRMWTAAEENSLEEGVQKHGEGKWKNIS